MAMPFEHLWVGPSYPSVLGLRLLAGRQLVDADADVTLNPAPIVITASFAQAIWPGKSPIGQLFQVEQNGLLYEVEGVVADFAYGSMSLATSHVILHATSLKVRVGNDLALAIRTQHPDQLVPVLRRQLTTLLPDAARLDVLTGRDVVARDLGRDRLGAWFFSGFGLVALVLGVGGVFGLVAYLAESRQREMGVRLALGATPRDLVRLAVPAGLWPVAVGALIGLTGSMWLARFVESLLLGIGRLDPLTYVGAGLLMMAVALAAGFVAARRLRRISPLEALRTD
jgi:hypothetical protein